MKKIILTVAAVFAFSFAYAQDAKMGLAKGDFVVTGSISTESIDSGGAATSGSSFSQSFGYFLSNDISLSLGFDSSTKGDDKSSTFALGAAYTFNAAKQFSSRIGASLGFGTANVGLPNDAKSEVFKLGYGINYFVSSHFALTADLAAFEYNSIKDETGKITTTTSFGINLSDISFGLAYKF